MNYSKAAFGLVKLRVAKYSVATRVRKIKIGVVSLLELTNKVATFLMLRSCILKEEKTQGVINIIYQINDINSYQCTVIVFSISRQLQIKLKCNLFKGAV